MNFIDFLFIFVLIALNAFFVAVEFAAVSSRRARLDILENADSSAARIVRGWLENTAARDRLIAGSQLGITVVSLALGAVGENAFEVLLTPYFESAHFPDWLAFLDSILPALPLIISLTVVTSLHVVLGEQVPKVAVLRAPERFALLAAPLMNLFTRIFRGFISLLDWATRQVLKLFGLTSSSGHVFVYSAEEIKEMVSGPEVAGTIQEPERKMLSAVIDFGEMVVRQVSVPRTEIIAVEANTSVEDAIRLTTEHAVTKMPVYRDDLDNVIGIIHLRDLVSALQNGNPAQTVQELAREAVFVPESIPVNDLMRNFRDRHTHIAIVLDEFGGTAGLVTLEDLLEEIIGVIQDPFDAAPPTIQSRPDGSALIDGLALIEEVNEHFNLHLENSNYDTIAGYVLGKLGHIPQTGEVIDDPQHHIRLKVEAMDRLRIDRVVLYHLD
ncbi:MAG TPA: hemolysin family protein [Anaerolineaceae bacterium]|nr:hemolysin family protein [Anaerolineaceae bacterium]